MTVTIPRGRAIDIVYHSVLLAWLLATGALLLRRDRPAATQRPSDQGHQWLHGIFTNEVSKPSHHIP